MRRTAQLFLIVIILGVLAQSSENPKTDYESVYVRPQIVFSQDQATPRNFASSTRPFLFREFRASDGILDGENVCYTMRSLIVAREAGSDMTRLVGQRTCTPASRFRMNHSSPRPK